MRKTLILTICGLILSFPFSVLFSWEYETELTGAILYHEGDNCGCACTYSWLTLLYSINEVEGFYTYDYLEDVLGDDVTDEKIALCLTTYAKNDKHTVIEGEVQQTSWEEIALYRTRL